MYELYRLGDSDSGQHGQKTPSAAPLVFPFKNYIRKTSSVISQRRFVNCRASLQGFEHVRLQHLVCTVKAQGVGAIEFVVGAIEELQTVNSERRTGG